MKREESSTQTNLSVQQVKEALQPILRKASLRPIEANALSDSADLEFLAEKSSMIGGVGAIQVYVWDRGDHRDVTVVALGNNQFERAIAGHGATARITTSRKMAGEVIAALQS